MATRDEVEYFLKQIRDKISVFDIAFNPRDKNLETLVELDITPAQRIEYINKLTADNYYSGPNTDTYDTTKPPYYEFGITIKSQVVYIKLSLGNVNKMVHCMSFHIAEREINYPLKQEKK